MSSASGKKEFFYIVVLILTFITVVVGATYALYYYFLFDLEKGGSAVYTGNLTIQYLSGDLIAPKFLMPTFGPDIDNIDNIDNVDNIYVNNFSVTNTGSVDSDVDIVISLKKNYFPNENIMYSIYDKNKLNTVEDGNEEEENNGVIASGYIDRLIDYNKKILVVDGKLLVNGKIVDDDKIVDDELVDDDDKLGIDRKFKLGIDGKFELVVAGGSLDVAATADNDDDDVVLAEGISLDSKETKDFILVIWWVDKGDKSNDGFNQNPGAGPNDADVNKDYIMECVKEDNNEKKEDNNEKIECYLVPYGLVGTLRVDANQRRG